MGKRPPMGPPPSGKEEYLGIAEMVFLTPENAKFYKTKNGFVCMNAHRLSTLRDADKLIVIENGKMPEAGTAEELLKKKGVYYKLYKMQAEALKTIGIEE